MMDVEHEDDVVYFMEQETIGLEIFRHLVEVWNYLLSTFINEFDLETGMMISRQANNLMVWDRQLFR